MRLLLFAFLFLSVLANAEEPVVRGPASVPNRIEGEQAKPNSEKLSRDWGGARSYIQKGGFTFFGTYLSDFAWGLTAHEVGFRWMGNLLLGADLSLDQMGAIPGGRIVMSAMGSHGRGLSQVTHDVQLASNIEVSVNSVRYYEFFYEQSIAASDLAISFGLQDLNSTMGVTKGSTLFLQSSFGFDGALALATPTSISTFPVTSPGLRVRYGGGNGFYANLGAFVGVARAPRELDSGQFSMNMRANGVLGAAEVGYHQSAEDAVGVRKVALMAWGYSKSFPRAQDEYSRKPQGLGLISEFGITPSYVAVARLSYADPNAQRYYSNIAVSIVGKGFFGELDHDQWGLGISRLYASSSMGAEAPHETAVEATMAWKFAPGVQVQPSAQYLVMPSATTRNSNGWALISRLRFDL